MLCSLSRHCKKTVWFFGAATALTITLCHNVEVTEPVDNKWRESKHLQSNIVDTYQLTQNYIEKGHAHFASGWNYPYSLC